MDITYCNNECSIGKKASKEFLNNNNSAFDAAIDFWHFVDECIKTCPYKDKHNTEEK